MIEGPPTELKEDTTSIEVSFAAPVYISNENQKRLMAVLDDICKEYETRHTDRVMWTFGYGQKMLTNPFLVDDDHPMEFDESTLSIECAERERYAGERDS